MARKKSRIPTPDPSKQDDVVIDDRGIFETVRTNDLTGLALP